MNGLAYCQEFDNILLSVVERQRRGHAKFHDLVHELIKGNIERCIISLHIFGKVISLNLILGLHCHEMKNKNANHSIQNV